MDGQSVAVIGIGCRLPGAHGAAEFWRLACEGRDAITEVPPDRFDVDRFFDPRPATPGKLVTRWGGFLDRPDTFDADFFGIAPREAMRMDPQQRLLLETAWEAVEDAGLTAAALAAARTGVFIGQMWSNYWDLMSRAAALDLYANTGTTRGSLSGRISFALDLRGPSISIDTACSSSLVAVHLACQSLRRGESSVALAGGVNLILTPAESITFSQGGMLSADGRCKFGAASADGFVRSDGVAVVVLKPLSRAVADGDAIYAVIHGSAVLNEGRGSGGLTTPSRAGQAETIRAACADAGVMASRVSYVEAHGTGTQAGDPVELAALAEVFGAERPAGRPLLVGSVKTNVGHTEAAAGVAGLIKTVLCLKHRMIPPSLHSAVLSTAVDWQAAPVVIPQEMTDWPGDDRPALAGVSSFGITGTNAHVVLGEHLDGRPRAACAGGRPRLLTISARGPAALRALASSYLGYLRSGGAGHGIPLRDICYSASRRRTHHDSRLTVVGTSHDEIAGKLRSFLNGEPAAGLGTAADVAEEAARIVFVFPGQGSQWAGMGRELLAASPVFLAAIGECDRAVRAVAGWSPAGLLRDEAAPLDGVEKIQPTLWAIQVALAALWRSRGIDPDVVVGHSMGEVAAACVAGVLSLADGAAVICRRSALLSRVAGRGAMVSVELSADECAALLAGYDGRISIAASNSPGSTVLSGDPGALDTLVASLRDRDVFCRRVKVDVASHSHQVDPLRDELLAGLDSIAPGPGDTPFFSTVLGEEMKGESLDAGYWAANLREPVRFGAAVAALLAAGPAYFVELSPHPVLVPAIKEALAAPDARGLAIGSTRRDEPEEATLLDGIAALCRAGYPVPWEKLHEPEARFVRLPGYPWQRQRFWYDGTDAPGPPPPGPALPAKGPSPGPGPGEAQIAGPSGIDATAISRDRASVESYLVARVAEVLGLPEHRVSPGRPLNRQGLDSLMALEVRARVRRELGVLLPVTRMLGGCDISGLATEVHDELEGHQE